MSIKRTTTAIVAIAAGLSLLVGCTAEPAPTTSPTPTETVEPTQAPSTVNPPETEDEAIAEAEAAIDRILIAQSEINAASGEGSERYGDLAVGPGLDYFQREALRMANGPVANESGQNVDGPATTEGVVIFEPVTAYGQEWEGTPNGLVIVPGCEDVSGVVLTTSEGTPGYRPESDRSKVEFQVTYDTDRQLWLVSNLIRFQGETC